MVAFTALLVGSRPSAVRAQAGSAEAEQLFRDGRQLMAAKRYAEACEAFETSNKLGPSVATELNLADCREKNGQLASAWGLFVDVERETRGNALHSGLNKTAKERGSALESRLSYLTISVSDESRIEGLTILRNGIVVDAGLWNRAVPVDGGELRIIARARGNEDWSTTVLVAVEKGRASVDVPKLKEIRAAEPPPTEVQAYAPPRPGMLTRQRKVAVGSAIVGVAALGVGGWLGVQSRDDDRAAYDLCPDVATPCADADEATRLSERAASRGLRANVAFGVGAAALVGAAILWLTGAPDDPSRETTIAPAIQSTFSGVTLMGTF